MRMRRLSVLAAGGVLALARVLLAQGVGPGGPFDTTYPLQSRVSVPEDPTYWGAAVGSSSDPVAVALDPLGPVWTKHVQTQPGMTILPGHRVLLTEYLTITGEREWTGWQERILTENFAWVDYLTTLRVAGSPAPGLSIDYTPPGAPPGSGVAFSFDALTPGTQLEIRTRLVYTGSQPFSGSIVVQEFPTPEPASAVLMGLGSLMIARRWRANRQA
jgi:hypothetical protein